jgi:TrmH family RNA methyltransferase
MKLVTLARDLARRKARERRGQFVAEGVRAVEALLASGLPTAGVLVAPALRATPRGATLAAALEGAGWAVHHVDDDELAGAAATEEPQGVLAVATIPTWDAEAVAAQAAPDARLLVLDAIQDPGNAGTMIRTAAAFGATATLLLPGTVDVWNAKVVRGAMGALFTQPTLPVTCDGARAFLQRVAATCWVADAAGTPVEALPPVPGRLALVIGNEGQGVSPAMRALADGLVGIPIAPVVESLNAAVAAGILLHACRAR